MPRSMRSHLPQSKCRTAKNLPVIPGPTSKIPPAGATAENWSDLLGLLPSRTGRGRRHVVDGIQPRLRTLPPIGEESPAALRRMCAKRFFLRLRTPAWSVRQDEISVPDIGQVSEEFVVPGEAIDIDLHDAQIRHRGAEMRIHHGAKMAIEVVWRDIHLIGFCGGCNFHRLPHPVPGRVD